MSYRFQRSGLGLALWCLLGVAGATPASLTDYFHGITTLRAHFTQEVRGTVSDRVQRTEGILAIYRPDRFYLEYTEPYRQLYVADGKTLWAYDEDLEQVTVHRQQGMLQNTPALILTQPEKLAASYTIVRREGDGKVVFELTPRDPNSQFELISIGFRGKQLVLMELRDALGQTTVLRFSRLQLNPLIDEARFRFTPPEGVDLIRADESF